VLLFPDAVIVEDCPLVAPINCAIPVVVPMEMAGLLEVQVAKTVCPEEGSVAVKVTEPNVRGAVKVPVPCGVHPVHEIVSPFDV